MALDALSRVNEDTVEIKEHRIAFEVCHERRVTIMTAERRSAAGASDASPVPCSGRLYGSHRRQSLELIRRCLPSHTTDSRVDGNEHA
jgi:hypothetical protein